MIRTLAATLAATAALVVLAGTADAAIRPVHTAPAASAVAHADSDPWD